MEINQEFFEAVTTGDYAKVSEMLEREPGLLEARNQQGLSPVLVALYYGEPTIADLMIGRGASLNIFEAAAAGRLDRVQELVNDQPELADAFSVDGFQPLGLASFFGHTETARFLLERGATVNSPSQNPQRVMPLHSATAGGHLEIARLLLEHGADPNARQTNDFTPLHAAAQNRQPEMIRLLINHGADREARSADGRSALDFAGEDAPQEIRDMLREREEMG